MAILTNGLFSSVKDHLTLLGYSFQTAESTNKIVFELGKHSDRPTIALRPYKNGVLVTAVYIGSEQAERDQAGLFNFINEANFVSVAARFYWYAPLKALVSEFWFLGPYDRIQFGLLFDQWIQDINSCFESQKLAGREYLRTA